MGGKIKRTSYVAIGCLVGLLVTIGFSQYQFSATQSADLIPTSPQQHVVYIKTEKTGSTTMSGIFWSYGLRNKLHLIMSRLPGNGGLINTRDLHFEKSWDICPDRSNVHMIINHARYNPEFYKKYFRERPKFITSLREPVSWFVSRVDFVKNYRNHTPRSVLNEDSLFYAKRHFITGVSRVFHNTFLLWLGFGPGSFQDIDAITRHINVIDQEFDLVLITEYFDDSLILLRRMIGWSMADIFYAKANSARHTSGVILTPEEKEKVVDADHNYGDLLLYQHFNRSLWQKISAEKEFFEEVELFREYNLKVKEFCESEKLSKDKTLSLKLHSKWEIAPISITDENCISIRLEDGLPLELYQQLDVYCPFRNTMSHGKYQKLQRDRRKTT